MVFILGSVRQYNILILGSPKNKGQWYSCLDCGKDFVQMPSVSSIQVLLIEKRNMLVQYGDAFIISTLI